MSRPFLDPISECSTLVDLLRWRALHQAAQRVYTFLVDGELEQIHLTYAELDRRARAIGAFLQSLGAIGERALLLYPPGLEYIAALFGCLYAGWIAVPSYPPRLNRPDARLQGIAADAQASVALTTSRIVSSLERRFSHAPYLKSLRWLTTENLASDWADEWRDPSVGGDTLALLQYTSGSTAAPRGVMLTHGNLLHNLSLIHWCFETTPDSRVVSWLPFYHDMGLIGGILGTTHCGGTSTLMSPVDFLQRPVRWLQAISRTRATVSGGPNFAYDLCVRKITPEQRATLDLSSWEIAFNGAETVRHQTLERFVAAFEPCGFRREALSPCYGLAEATLIVSGGPKAAPPVLHTVQGAALESNQLVATSLEDEDARTLVGCGQTLPEQGIAIVDPESLTLCLPNQIGEIWASGPSVAQGYWNQPGKTRDTFRAYLADTGEGPFLRTGDLGFLEDGKLFIAGRLKDLIIIDGRNHHPQDIELTVEQSHPALRPDCCAAFSIDVDDEERLIIVAEVKRHYRPGQRQERAAPGFDSARPSSLDAREVIGAVRKAVAEYHDMRVHDMLLLRAWSIPKTSSGKIQRHACRAGYLAGTLRPWVRR
ncbi:MAG: fatty acyl-AMP ligase [Anaerolineae bacterium]|jgi:acyl-CoA synthetase (AMP-forming)/AMP-acid ligase II